MLGPRFRCPHPLRKRPALNSCACLAAAVAARMAANLAAAAAAASRRASGGRRWGASGRTRRRSASSATATRCASTSGRASTGSSSTGPPSPPPPTPHPQLSGVPGTVCSQAARPAVQPPMSHLRRARAAVPRAVDSAPARAPLLSRAAPPRRRAAQVPAPRLDPGRRDGPRQDRPGGARPGPARLASPALTYRPPPGPPLRERLRARLPAVERGAPSSCSGRSLGARVPAVPGPVRLAGG